MLDGFSARRVHCMDAMDRNVSNDARPPLRIFPQAVYATSTGSAAGPAGSDDRKDRVVRNTFGSANSVEPKPEGPANRRENQDPGPRSPIRIGRIKRFFLRLAGCDIDELHREVIDAERSRIEAEYNQFYWRKTGNVIEDMIRQGRTR